MQAAPVTAPGRRTRAALLDAGMDVANKHGLAGLSVNLVVAEAGVAKGTFYVHFPDRQAFIDSLHERFHRRVDSVVAEATTGMAPGAETIATAAEGYLNMCLANHAVKALALEARAEGSMSAAIARRHDRFASAAIPSFKAMGWPDPSAAAQLVAAMTSEIAIREFDARRRLPASRRTLRRFLGVDPE